MVDTKHADLFGAAAACVVNNADHPELPQGVSERGVVLLGFGWVKGPTGKPASSRIGWMPLREGESPRLTDTRCFSGDPKKWSESADDAVVVFEHDGFTSVSLAWLEGPGRWIYLYSMANDDDDNHLDRPGVARIGASPWDWSPAISIFDPRVDSHAPPAQKPYGLYMHKKDLDTFNPDIPPNKPMEHDGWAYGAYLLNCFTEWDETSRELTVTYLLSLSCPYQPQLMQTRMQVESPIRRAAAFLALAVQHLADARQVEGIDRAGAAIQAYTDAAGQPGANRDAVAAGLTDVSTLLTTIVPPVQQPLFLAQTLRGDLDAVNGADPMTVTPSLTADAGLLSTVGLTAKGVDTQQTVIDLLRAFTPAEPNRLQYLISVAEAQHNLIVRLIADTRPTQAASSARQTIDAYRGYIAAGGTDVSRLNRDITELQKQLSSPPVGLRAEPVEALQLLIAAFHAAPPPQAASERLEFQIMFAEARHNLIARLLDDSRRTEASALVAETVAAYRDYAAEPGAESPRAASDLTQLAGVLAAASLTSESQRAQQAADQLPAG
jgi:hypothetical protein